MIPVRFQSLPARATAELVDNLNRSPSLRPRPELPAKPAAHGVAPVGAAGFAIGPKASRPKRDKGAQRESRGEWFSAASPKSTVRHELGGLANGQSEFTK